MDHCFGDINGVFVVAYEPPPARHPSKGSFDDRRGGRTSKPACLSVRPMISKTKSRQAAASINRVRSYTAAGKITWRVQRLAQVGRRSATALWRRR